ncbi:hypothetical protein BDR07DRAFT_1456781 [Suillus spraguei]|nr:hypothetical protein BDR07DRAFT_1456781 [Suillus spraguei]
MYNTKSSSMPRLKVREKMPAMKFKADFIPRRRFMSAWEQRSSRTMRRTNHILPASNVAAKPYETVAFRIPAREIEDEADIGTGHIGILIRTSVASTSCSSPANGTARCNFSFLVMLVFIHALDCLDQLHLDKFSFHLRLSSGDE